MDLEIRVAAIGAFFLVPPDKWLFATHGDVADAKRRANEYYKAAGTYEGAEYQIEEFVRQWVLTQLLAAYKYPAEWIGERIIIEEPVKMGSTEKAADVSIKNGNRRTFLYVEAKKRKVDDNEFVEAERQLETYLSSTHTATIGMVTDGDRVKTVRKKIDPNDFEYIPDLPAYGLDAKIKTQLVRELPDEINEGRSTGLRVLDNEYERVLFDCHSAARDIDGLHADEALDEICKVIYTKIFDERWLTKQPEGTPFRFQTYGASNASEVASNIRVLYEDARTADIEVYSKRIPGYERSRGVFKNQIRLSDAALYRVVERLQEFSLIDSKADIKGRAFQKILGPAIRAGMGQYFTPDPIVQLAIGAIQPKATDLILDPFCGSAHFLTKALEYVLDDKDQKLTAHDVHEFKFFHLHGIEKSERMVRIAMTDMMLHDDGHTNIRNQDALLSFDNYPDIIALRDDGKADPAVFDVVITNPPFGSIMKQEVMQMLGRFDLGHKKKSLPLEILGLERSLQFLKPGGRLAIVLPEHLMKGKSAIFVRKWLYGIASIKAIFFFPEEAFTPYGAMVKTCLCILQKLKVAEQADDEEPTFLCEVENLGYEATGKSKAGSEVTDATTEFHKQVKWS
jgi:type I restriction enzyme M protein